MVANCSDEQAHILENRQSFFVNGFEFVLAYLLRKTQGFDLFLFIILISVLTDLGGYIFGKIFKGPKLTKISPNKTYSGVIGSFLVSVIGGLIYL